MLRDFFDRVEYAIVDSCQSGGVSAAIADVKLHHFEEGLRHSSVESFGLFIHVKLLRE